MLTREQVAGCLRGLLHEIGGIPVERITDAATVDNELQLSSLAFAELQVALEEKYDVLIDPIEVVERSSFGAIVEYVHGLAVAAAAS